MTQKSTPNTDMPSPANPDPRYIRPRRLRVLLYFKNSFNRISLKHTRIINVFVNCLTNIFIFSSNPVCELTYLTILIAQIIITKYGIISIKDSEKIAKIFIFFLNKIYILK